MPQKSRLRCYFGCINEGPLHQFPNPNTDNSENLEKFYAWKRVLDSSTQEKGNIYIHNSIRLCNNHFMKCYCLPSRHLTRNAVPTLCLEQQGGSREHEINQPPPTNQTSDHVSEQPQPLEVQTRNLESVQPSTSAVYQPKRPTETRKRTRSLDAENKVIIKLKKKLEKVFSKYNSQKKKIRAAQNMSMSKTFLTIIEKLPPEIQTFTKLQLKSSIKPRGRRFTIEEKVMALTIFKQSPKAYKLMQKMFVLPSKRCLQSILRNFSVKPGVNPEVKQELKNMLQSMPQEKKLVTLLFDEISLASGIEYNSTTGQIVGFEDLGNNKRNKTLADHALVFMIKGIKSKCKQPISFTFCKSATKASDLKNLLKEIIKQLNNIGFKVVATVCDQAASNVKAIKELQDETVKKYLEHGIIYDSNAFEIENNKVYPLFDTPHLLKGIRNNLMVKDAQFVQNGETKWAKWEHLKLLLDIDDGDDEIRLVNKLTEKHVIKDKIPKMKVTFAAQVFSQRVSSALRFLAKHKVLPEECKGTADFLLIFDRLFDSFNGHSYKLTDKAYRQCVKSNSPHFQLWDNLIPILETIKFKSVVRINERELIKYVSVPLVKNWIHNINTFKELWKYLIDNHDVKNLLTRNFNQDPLENFFSSIRSNGIRNVNPTCNQFSNAFKTLIINNINSPHSPRANCENDDNNTFQSMINLLDKKSHISHNNDFECDVDCLLKVMGEIKVNDSLVYAESKKYVIGYVIKKCKSKIFKKCNYCMHDLCRSEVDLDSFNYEIDYTKKSLFHPNEKFIELMTDIFYITVACLHDCPESTNLKEKIKLLLNCACDYNIITCKRHKDDLIDFINNLSINLIIHSWCKGVNRILSGKCSKFNKNDKIKQQAFDYCLKRRINK